MNTHPEALRLADELDVGDFDVVTNYEAASELRRMHDLLGKANALCRIRAEEIERLKAQPAQEPVAWINTTGDFLFQHPEEHGRENEEWFPLVHQNTSPPANTNAGKPWVGLTDEEVDECYYWKGRQWTTDELVRHVEAKLREKNNG